MDGTHTNIHALRPGFLSPSAGLKFADIPNGLAAISKVPMAGWAQIAAYFGFVEFSGGFDDYKTGTPGDYGFKVLTASDPAEKTKKLSAELANGRLAMMAIIGMFFQAASIAYSLLFQTACASAFALFVHVMTSLSCCNFGLLVFDSTGVPFIMYISCTGWPHWQRLGRLGQLHRISSSRIRERARSAGPCGILGSGWFVRGRQRGELQAPPCYRNQARKDCHACNYGIYHPRDHGKVPWLLKPIGRP